MAISAALKRAIHVAREKTVGMSESKIRKLAFKEWAAPFVEAQVRRDDTALAAARSDRDAKAIALQDADEAVKEAKANIPEAAAVEVEKIT